MSHINDRVQKGIGQVTAPFWRVFGLIASIIGWIIGIAFILGLVFGGIVIFNLSKAGTLDEGIEKLEITLKENRLLRPLSGVIDVLKKLSTPEGTLEITQGSQWKSTIDKNSINRDLGVKIENFKAIDERIKVSELTNTERFPKIKAIASGTILTLDSSEVMFSCITEDEDKSGEILDQDSIIITYPEIEEFFQIECSYDVESFDINDNLLTDTQKIKIKASYEFTTLGHFSTYILQQDVLDEQKRNKEDIFSLINDKNLNKAERTVRSVYTYGPIKLTMGSSSQPYTEESPYNLYIEMKEDDNWNGDLEEITEFSLLIPEEINIITNDFEYSNTEGNWDVYRAKNSLIDEFNRKEGKITTSVKFSINNPPETISQTFIRSRLKYNFNEIKSETITFINNQDE
tara:strand:+ start:117 stop:1325 length:1209 start_codon:yes stop_codon:yes gene_type:complete